MRVQHATGAAYNIMLDGEIRSASDFVYAIRAESPGSVSLCQTEFEALGARLPVTHVIEFDVPVLQLRLNEIGDVIVPSPVSLVGRNAVSITIPR